MNYLDAQLNVLTTMFGMEVPTGNGFHDFSVKRENDSSFNVRNSDNIDDYDREFGSVINIVDMQKEHSIYISYISGPNVMGPKNNDWRARQAHHGDGRFLKLDTTFRTISIPARNDYDLFRSMIVKALVASLRKMLQLGYKYAIMASPSSGIYAGHYKKRIQAEYHHVCLQALTETYVTERDRFEAVIVPIY